ncbi:MAG TPA: radical SAM protein [Candidatus Acidoferrales bacterium]|nr:radical SAM protein [Candidatus Acidoferrales bacterium]
MKLKDIVPAWSRILHGRRPFLSLEITRECPLHCPGCYAYEPNHLGTGGPLRQLADYRGDELVTGVLSLVRRLRPLHISIVGGEPLVRYRELGILLPKLARLGVEVQLVTSAVRQIPAEWHRLPNLHLVVSVDGLAPEHDRRRSPATYSRIVQNIAGQQIIVHCTITRQLLAPGYLREFARFWSARAEARKIWFSLFTPQEGDQSAERLGPPDRLAAIEELAQLRREFPKIQMPDAVLQGYVHPPNSPAECIFAQTTNCISADLTTEITPCQFGGRPVCSECGCMASAGLASIGNYKLGGVLPVSRIFAASKRLGERFAEGPTPNRGF